EAPVPPALRPSSIPSTSSVPAGARSLPATGVTVPALAALASMAAALGLLAVRRPSRPPR
ncbi:MAG TPA: hypothetical protein VJ804_08710, partial [Acidimicrobiales bacterium]|nr:hypothetical protein [Acidimicrobiales bacterium]